MKIAIFESITTPGGHEVDFDRILVDECKGLGHEVMLYVPEKFKFNVQYGVPVHYLAGAGVSYTGLRGFKKSLASIRREVNRQRWFRQMYHRAAQGEFDAMIIPTSTYRYLRALHINILKKSPVPVIFILHGINPGEAPKFFKQLANLSQYPHIKAAVLTFSKDVFGHTFNNMFCIDPPAYIPRDILPQDGVAVTRGREGEQPLKLGFFGQYRREKKLDDFLDAFIAGCYTQPVELLVQGATMKPEDSEDFERIIGKYQHCQSIKFLHKGLFGKDWQTAIANVDALLMPYSAARYRYHWAGMLFTAIGYQKPVVLSSEINPEVSEQFELGCVFESGNSQSLHRAIEQFINTFQDKSPVYKSELARAYQQYNPQSFAERLITLCKIN